MSQLRPKLRQVNEVLWSLPLHQSPIASVAGTGSVTWGKSPDGRDCLICVPGASPGNTVAFISQALTATIPFGKAISIRYRIKAVSLVAPGMPAMYWSYSSAIFGGADTVGITSTVADQGTYDWKERNVVWYPNADVTNFQLKLGVSGGPGASGTLYISDVQVLALDVTDPVRPTSDLTYMQPGPQLRGFQLGPSPSRRDFFGARDNYKANIIRFGIYNGNADYPQINNAGLQSVPTYKAWFNSKAQEVVAIRDYARQNGMKVALSLGRMPGNMLDGRISGFSYILNSDYYLAMLDAWKTLATMFLGDDTFLGFDLVNEPGIVTEMPPGGADHVSYITGFLDAIRVIREIDPTRTIIAESFLGIGHPLWARYGTVLRDENGDAIPNIIYSAHIYQPGSSYNLSAGAANTYPGFQIKNQQHVTYAGNKSFGDPGLTIDKAYLRDQVQALRDFQLQHRVPIYIGEIGLQRWCLGAAQWYTDICSICDEYGWHYTIFELLDGQFSPEMSATPVGGTGTHVGPTTDRALALKAAMAQNVVPFDPTAVSTPTITVADVSATAIVVCWDTGRDPIETLSVGMRISGGSWTDVSKSRDSVSHTFTGLVVGASYEFRVTLNGTAVGMVAKTKAITRLLEAISPAAKAAALGGWELRLITSDYSGPIIRIRTGGSEYDIGANANGDLDEVDLLNRCGSGDGFIVTHYDVTGKGQHRTQTNTDRQPQIVFAGVINKINGKPAVKYAGGQGIAGGAIGLAGGSMTLMGIGQQDAGNVGNTTICGEFSSSLGCLYWVLPGQSPGPTGEAKMYIRNDTGNVFASDLAELTSVGGFPVGSVGQFLVQDRDHRKIWIGSKNISTPVTDVALNSAVPFGTLTANRFSIGARDRAGLGFDSAIKMQLHGLLAFGTVLSSADEQIIRASQLQAYNAG